MNTPCLGGPLDASESARSGTPDSRSALGRLVDNVAGRPLPWSSLAGGTIVVTGSRGTIGSLLCRTVLAASRQHDLNVKLIASARPESHIPGGEARVSCRYLNQRMPSLTPWNVSTESSEVLRECVASAPGPVLIFHTAASTSSQRMRDDPIGVFRGIVRGAENVLELARLNPLSRVVLLSSMEVYGALQDDNLHPVDESRLGVLDLVDPRSCYPLGKRAAEHLAALYATQAGVSTVSARLAQVVGAGIRPEDPRAVASFARAALSGEDIVLRSDGKSIGNYCDSADAVEALLRLGLSAAAGAFNVANPAASTSIDEVARLVADTLGGDRCRVVHEPLDRMVTGYAAPTRNRLAIDRMRALGWMPTRGLADSIKEMTQHWRDLADAHMATDVPMRLLGLERGFMG